MEADIGTICISAEGAQGSMCLPPPLPIPTPFLLLHYYIVWLRNSIVSQNLKLNILQKFLEIAKTKMCAATLLLYNLLSAAQTPVC